MATSPTENHNSCLKKSTFWGVGVSAVTALNKVIRPMHPIKMANPIKPQSKYWINLRSNILHFTPVSAFLS
jgi:hypothetical protein